MSLPADQQSLLNGMDRALEAGDPGLAAMFAAFTRLTGDDGPPCAERLTPGRGRIATGLGALRRLVRASAVVPAVVAVGLMAAIIAIGVATSGWSACSTASQQPRMQAGVAACAWSAHGSAK